MSLEMDMSVSSPWFQRPEGTDPKDLPLPEDLRLSTRKFSWFSHGKRNIHVSLEIMKSVVWRKVGCGGAHYSCSCEGVQALDRGAFSGPLKEVHSPWCVTVVTLTEEVEVWRPTVECQRTCTWPCMLHLMPWRLSRKDVLCRMGTQALWS